MKIKKNFSKHFVLLFCVLIYLLSIEPASIKAGISNPGEFSLLNNESQMIIKALGILDDYFPAFNTKLKFTSQIEMDI